MFWEGYQVNLALAREVLRTNCDKAFILSRRQKAESFRRQNFATTVEGRIYSLSAARSQS
jgi:hypothetical protein